MRRLKFSVPLLAAVVLIAGCGSPTKTSTTTTTTGPAAVSPAAVACASPTAGFMGACNPQRSEGLKLTRTPKSSFGGIQGVDISNNNGPVSFTYLRSHGIDFAYVKGDEACHRDSDFDGNIQRAAAVHMPVGIYDFSRPGSISSASEAACMASLTRYALAHHATLLPDDFDVESFNEGVSGQGVCNWLHAAENDLRADLRGVKAAVYGSVGTYPGCFPNGTEQWPADWGISFAPTLPGYSGEPFDWQYFGPRFASATLDGMDRDKGSSKIFKTEFGAPKPKPLTHAQKVAKWHRELNVHYALRAELRTKIDAHHCRLGSPYFGHAKPRNWHTRCGQALAAGQRENREIKSFHRKGIF